MEMEVNVGRNDEVGLRVPTRVTGMWVALLCGIEERRVLVTVIPLGIAGVFLDISGHHRDPK
jgi:hypothetical protein